MAPTGKMLRLSIAAWLALLMFLTPGLAQDGPTAELPVTRVVLFTSGVGYFEHSGTVTGDAEIALAVAADQMDDLLQSLVLQDFDGGTIHPVRYDASDPLGRILASYSLDLSRAPTLADLLLQARGEALLIEAGSPLEGTLLSVERVPGPEDTFTMFLTLSTASGLQRIGLDEVRQIRFERAELQAELEAALAAIARFRSVDDKTVRLRFSGEGERRVRVGYIREMPVWKTSYRLVLNDDGSADLQGWAIFDNPTNIDLDGVSVSFVAGQPISFITDLYNPVYVGRPRVRVQVAQPLTPGADIGEFAPAPVLAPAATPQEEERNRAAGFAAGADDAFFEAEPSPEPQLQGAGVEAMAQGGRTGATFEYRVSEPVTIGRYESAMIPIVQQTVEAPLVSLYDPSLLELHPLRAVRLLNDTGLHLAAGSVTLFGAGGFTGNAQLGDVVAGDTRTLSYAVDLDVDILRTASNDPQEITAVTIRNGLIESTLLLRQRTVYRIEVSEGEARFLVIDHPKRNGFEVVSPTPAPAETPSSYRFGVAIGEVPDDDTIPTQLSCDPEGESCSLEVVLERTTIDRVALSNLGGDQIAFYLENFELSDDDRAALTEVLELNRQIVALDRAIADNRTRLTDIDQEQSRIRQNMAQLDRNSELYRRYVSDLGAQENEIDRVQVRLEEQRAGLLALQEQLDEVIRRLIVDTTE